MNKIQEYLPGLGASNAFFLIAGPCVVENKDVCFRVAEHLKALTEKLGVPYIFKASFKKANRTRIDSFTGIGNEEALHILQSVKEQFTLPVLTDIHTEADAAMAAQVVDVLQIPAFLARQTDLLVAAALTGKVVNIKKGQFMSPGAMQHAARKVAESGNEKIILTDRGTMFGYHDLIVDFRGIPQMQLYGYPVVVDVTHALQAPNQSSGVTGGQPGMIETIARAAVAVGVDGIFMETHPEPSKALSDGANMLPLAETAQLLNKLLRIYSAAQT